VRTFLTSLKARGARRAPDGALTSHELARPGGRCDGGATLGGTGAKRPRDSHRNQTGSSALDLRRTAGCRPSATPGTARHRLAAVTPADRASRENGHPPGAPALSRAKITVKSATACGLRVLRMALRATLDRDLPRHMIAPIGWMARTRLAPKMQQGTGLRSYSVRLRRQLAPVRRETLWRVLPWSCGRPREMSRQYAPARCQQD
jgi:hypothetical protein